MKDEALPHLSLNLNLLVSKNIPNNCKVGRELILSCWLVRWEFEPAIFSTRQVEKRQQNRASNVHNKQICIKSENNKIIIGILRLGYKNNIGTVKMYARSNLIYFSVKLLHFVQKILFCCNFSQVSRVN